LKTKLAENILILLVGTLLIWQSAYVFCYPQPDTGRWIGDESWRMLTLKGMAVEGKPIIVEAEGSTLAHGVGVLHGSVWLMTAMAGVPAHIFADKIDPISVGRIASLVLGFLFLFQLYWVLKRFNVERIVALFFILAVVVSELYLLSSHSARMDIFVTNFLLFVIILLQKRTQPFLLGLIVGSGPFIYPHAISLMVLPSMLISYFFIKDKEWKRLGLFAGGAAITLGLACAIYTILTGHFGLFGEATERHTQFKGVAESIPIMKFFSWNVQKVNVFARLGMWLDVAWPILFGVVSALVYPSRHHVGLDRIAKRLLAVVTLIVFSTFLFQGPAIYYSIYVVPIVALVGFILMSKHAGNRIGPKIATGIFVVGGIIMSAFHINHLEAHAKAEMPAFVKNREAVKELIAPIGSASNPPKVLAEIATLQFLMDKPNVKLMTHHFLWLPDSDRDPLQVLRDSKVDYILRYANSPILNEQLLADFEPIAEKTGQLLENSYKSANPNCDTLRLYRRVRKG
jgi:uncharacterized protein with PQ loop repeat